MSGRVKWKELCRVPEGEKEKGRQSREEGWTQKVEGDAGGNGEFLDLDCCTLEGGHNRRTGKVGLKV